MKYQLCDMVLLEVIKSIIREKEVSRIAPTHVLVLKDLGFLKDREMVQSELKELESAGLIKTGNTINDRYIIVL